MYIYTYRYIYILVYMHTYIHIRSFVRCSSGGPGSEQEIVRSL